MINQTWITTWDHLSIQWFLVYHTRLHHTITIQVIDIHWFFLRLFSVHIYTYMFVLSRTIFSETQTLWDGNHGNLRSLEKHGLFLDLFLPLQMWIHQVKTCKLQSPEIFVLHQFFLNGLWQGFWVLNANFQQLWGRFGSLMWEIVVVSWAWLGWVVTWGINDPLGVDVFLHHGCFFDRNSDEKPCTYCSEASKSF